MNADTSGSLEELRVMQEQMDRLLEKNRHRMEEDVADEEPWQPPADICETGHSLVVKMELPEVDREDIRIRVEGGYLVIEGERHAEAEGESFYHRLERSYGAFRRTFLLTTEVDCDRISASCDRGVLKIVLPKQRQDDLRELEIEQSP